MTTCEAQVEKLEKLKQAPQVQGEVNESPDVPAVGETSVPDEPPPVFEPFESFESPKPERMNVHTETDPNKKFEYDQRLREVLRQARASTASASTGLAGPEQADVGEPQVLSPDDIAHELERTLAWTSMLLL